MWYSTLAQERTRARYKPSKHKSISKAQSPSEKPLRAFLHARKQQPHKRASRRELQPSNLHNRREPREGEKEREREKGAYREVREARKREGKGKKRKAREKRTVRRKERRESPF